MRAPPEGGGSRKRSSSGAFPSLFLVVVVLVLLLIAVAGDKHGSRGGPDPLHHSRRPSALPRKANPFHVSTTHAQPPHSQNCTDEEGDTKSMYEDDKRIIHTGPNPLHN